MKLLSVALILAGLWLATLTLTIHAAVLIDAAQPDFGDDL